MKNIYRAYVLSALKNSFFWLGIWVLYYLRYTNYQGIGLIETVMILLMIATEIPTGAIADLLGRKKTLCIAFLLMAVGQIYMGFAHNLTDLLWSVSIITIGHAFYSGTLEALVYDSLKEAHQENHFDKINANINSIGLVGLAIASTLGGFIYGQFPNLPYILNGLACLIGFIVALGLTEPKVDSVSFNLKNYLTQMKQGFVEIKQSTLRVAILNILLIASIIVITYEVVNSVLLVQYGLSALWLGVMGAVMAIVSAISIQVIPRVLKKYSPVKSASLAAVMYGGSLLLSGFSGWFGVGIVTIRNGIESVHSTLTSIIVNKEISSKNRATTLSTFNMMKSLPYAVVAVLAGKAMDDIGTIPFAITLGVVALLVTVAFKLIPSRNLAAHNG